MSETAKTVILASLVAFVVAFTVAVLVGGKEVIREVVSLGADGDTGFTNLVASGDVTVGDDLTVTDDTTIGGSITSGELFTQGGGWFSTSTTGTLTEAQMLANNGIYVTAAGAGQAALVLTLPATSTMTTLLATAGDCATWVIDASDVAAATTTTITAGTGWDLVGLDATGAGAGADVIDGAEFGQLTACRKVDTDVVGYVTEWIAAD